MKPYLFVLLLQLLGSFAALCVLAGTRLTFCVASGLLWGVAIHSFIALGVVLVSHFAGWLPLYHTALIVSLILLATTVAVVVFLSNAARWGCSRRRVLAAQGAGLAAAALCTGASLAWNLSTFSVDSFTFVERGLALARITDPRYSALEFLHTRGVFAVLLHAATGANGVEYLYFLTPVVSVAFLVTLAVTVLSAVSLLGRSRRAGAWTAFLGISWLASCYFVTFQMFYLHVNWLAGIYVFLLFYTVWMALQTRENRWFVLAAGAVFAFVLLRVEAPLFAAVFLYLLALERRGHDGRPLWPNVAMALPSIVWCSCLSVIIGDARGTVDRTRLIAMSGALAGSIALAWCIRRPWLSARASWLRAGGLAALIAVLVILLADRADWMVTRSLILFADALVAGNWSTGWLLIASFALAAPLLGRMPHQEFLLLWVAASLMLMFEMGYFASWRLGWSDSGNRMLTHLLPAVAWVMLVKSAAIAPTESGSAEPALASGGTAGRG